jgi:predicted enzyme related to lactoylglutathione lyase
MAPVEQFEIHAEDPHRAATFYGDVFGWGLTPGDGPGDTWLVTAGSEDEADGALHSARPLGRPTPTDAVFAIEVGDLDSVVEVALAAGARIVEGKHALPGEGWSARLHDPEGNLLGLVEPDPTAA